MRIKPGNYFDPDDEIDDFAIELEFEGRLQIGNIVIQKFHDGYDIETQTHEIGIVEKTGEVHVGRREWDRRFPVTDEMFGVVKTPPEEKE